MIGKLSIVTALCLVPLIASAQTPAKPTIKREAAKQVSASDGPQMFQSYCSPCHGKTGRGDGPAAAALKTRPADLTQLAKKHGGTFSDKDFEDKINGTAVSAHGSTEMPVWGPIFRDLSGNDKLRVYNLKQYVDSIQEK
jgi:mono/diheme cytochrome c family protein